MAPTFHFSGALTWSLAALFSYVVLKIVYNLFLHPLRKFPGPISHRASVLPYVFKVARGKWTSDILPLAEKYGPVVRVTPNQLIFTHPDAWRDVYSHHNGAVVKGEEFSKFGLFYRDRANPPSILGEYRDNHALIRRQLTHGFSDKSLREQEPIIKGYVDLFIKRLRERCVPVSGVGSEKERLLQSKTAFDMRHWYNYATYDIIGDMAFGEPFGCLEKGEADEGVTIIEGGLLSQRYVMAVKELGLERLVSLILRNRSASLLRHRRHTAAVLRRRMALNVERPDLIEGLLRKQDDWNMPFERLRSNAGLLIIAGSETTATLLSGVTYLLLRNTDCLDKLKHEVRSNFKSDEEITFSSVENLPYMLACLREALRCYPPVAGSMPRVVPQGGGHIAGDFVPEKTVVSVAQWPMYHSSRNFTEPFAFKPDRFLEPEKYPNDRLDAVNPFSVGPRNCIGKNLAYAEMRMILTRLVFNFDMELVDAHDDWMNQNSFFLWTKPPLNVYLTPVR